MNEQVLAGEITLLLREINDGKPGAVGLLMEMVYQNLRLAARNLCAMGPKGTLSPTCVVHEFFLRFADFVLEKECRFTNRDEFFGFARKIMRNVLADHARGHMAGKRGKDPEILPLEAVSELVSGSPHHSFCWDEAFSLFEKVYPRSCQVMELRYFFGLSIDETAALMKTSRNTVKRDWAFGKTWLYRYVKTNHCR